MNAEQRRIQRRSAVASRGLEPTGTTATKACPPPRASGDLADGGPRWSYGARGYALHRSLRQLLTRPWASLTTLLALGIVLALPALLLFSYSALDALAARTIEGESLTAYLNPGVDDLQGATLATELVARPDIERTRYISRDEALAMFRANSDVGDALDLLGTNPLPGAVVVDPALGRTDDALIGALAERLIAHADVERVQVDLDWVRRLQAVLSLISRIGALMGGFLVLTALLVITNTIRLELNRRRAELEVSHLLGASKLFVHRSTLYTGALYGFLGGLVACMLSLSALLLVRAPATELARLYNSEFRLPLPAVSQFALILAIATVLGMLGALATLYGVARQKVLLRA